MWPDQKEIMKLKTLDRKKWKDVITLCKRMGLSPEEALILVKADMIRSKLLAQRSARLLELDPHLPDLWERIKKRKNSTSS